MNGTPPEQESGTADRRHDLLRALLIIGAGLWAFSPALHGGWIWDDTHLITQNGLIHDPAGLWKIWFEPRSLVDYLPLKVSVEWLEWHLWHNDTLGYHLTSIVLHLISSLLIWRLFHRLGLKWAWLGGLIFAVHPVNVESVAWISELKNTLSLPLFLLAMCAYLDFDERGKRGDYFLALGLFLAALLCKASVIMFPAIILLYAWWKHGRIRWIDFKASAPFFVLSLALGLVTLSFVHRATAEYPVPMGGLLSRLACAGLAISFYFSKCILPVGLMPIYPRWVVDPPSLLQLLPWPILIGVLFLCWTKRATWGRPALLGLGFFLMNLAPFIGFTAGSYMSFTWVMDHVLYLPMVGLIGLAVAAMGQVERLLEPVARSFSIGVLMVAIALLAWHSHTYASVFTSEETLWSYAAQKNPEVGPAHNNLGLALAAKGDFTGAILEYRRALQINSTAEVQNNLGLALMQEGQLREAIVQFEAASRLDPRYPLPHNNLGLVAMQANRLSDAIAEYETALRLDPFYVVAHNNLGLALVQAGRIPEAIAQFEATLQLDPGYIDAHNNLGSLLLQSGKIPEAVAHFQAILEVDPGNAVAHYNLGDALMQNGNPAEAIAQFEQALPSSPRMADAHYALGNALIQTGHLSEAIAHYEQALEIEPGNSDAHVNLGNALLQSGRTPEAIDQYEQALKITPADTDVRKTLGLVLLKAGRIPEAKAQFEIILQGHPGDDDAKKILTQIEKMKAATRP